MDYAGYSSLAVIAASAGKANVSTPSLDYSLSIGMWKMIDDILEGPEKIRKEGEKYLIRYPAEDKGEYDRRLAQAPWRPEFEDALGALASKPFTQEVKINDGGSSRVKEYVENIDTLGNNLTVFLQGCFAGGIAKGVHGIFVDYTRMDRKLDGKPYSIAEENAMGARPYWVSLSAERMISIRFEVVKGREVVTHLRFLDPVIRTAPDGWGEIYVPRVRVCEPGTWQIWEISPVSREWYMQSWGESSIKDEVPLALFWTGKRSGNHRVLPPLRSLADMQIELYRALSRKDEIETYAGSPMLKALGIAAPKPTDPPILVGPKRILFAPAPMGGGTTDWGYVEPSADNLRQVTENVEQIIADMQRLGHQPMVQKAGGITATATAVEGAKAHSVLQAWTVKQKDAAEQAMVFTSQYLGEPSKVELTINTDFNAEPFAQAPLDALDKARTRKDLSIETYWDGLQRFSVLKSDFDPKKEKEAVEKEAADAQEELEGEVAIDPITGKPLPPPSGGPGGGPGGAPVPKPAPKLRAV